MDRAALTMDTSTWTTGSWRAAAAGQGGQLPLSEDPGRMGAGRELKREGDSYDQCPLPSGRHQAIILQLRNLKTKS